MMLVLFLQLLIAVFAAVALCPAVTAWVGAFVLSREPVRAHVVLPPMSRLRHRLAAFLPSRG